jgi:lysophospholipase L1-like esterase
MNITPIVISAMILISSLAHAQEEDKNQALTKNMSPKLVIIGASYAESWPITQVGCLEVVNQGIHGQVSSEVQARFAQDALASNPKAVLIWGFINDFSNNPRDVEDETQQTAIQNIKAMAEAAQSAGVVPVIATEVTMGMPDSYLDRFMAWTGEIRGKQSFQQYISTNVMSVNRWVRDYAKQQGYPLLDIEHLMTNEEGNRKTGYFTEDLSHITEKAYQDLDHYATSQLEEQLIKAHRLCAED